LFASLSTQALRKLKREHGAVQVRGRDFKREYAKEKLRENMGQCESKERVFKE
jgi:ABC-type branched-subunit amino acid transport system ATPase component